MNVAALSSLLIQHEGNVLKPYTDTAGKLTIGVGRNLTDCGITAEESGILLANDIERVRLELDRYCSWWTLLSETRQLVLADMCFNLGIHKLLTFKRFLAAAMAGQWDAAADEMLNSQWCHQVGQRAITLSRMMRTGQQ